MLTVGTNNAWNVSEFVVWLNSIILVLAYSSYWLLLLVGEANTLLVVVTPDTVTAFLIVTSC